MTTVARSPVRRRVGGQIIAAFAAVYVIWGSTYLFIRIAVETMPPLLMAGVRYIIAGGVLLAITSRMPKPVNVFAFVLIGLIPVVIFALLLIVAHQK